jgi:hypothetical protein
MANDYITSTDAFGDISEGSYASSDYAEMAAFVTSASRLIDQEFGRWEGFFYPSTDTATYYYDGSGFAEQEIDEFASISQVSVSEQGSLTSSDYTDWTITTDYLTLPYNTTNKAKPINRLAITQYNGTKGGWYRYQKNIKVVGIAGYSTTPPDIIKQACKIQAVRWFMRAKGGYQDVTGSDETGRLFYKGQSELDGDVKLLLRPLKLELDR